MEPPEFGIRFVKEMSEVDRSNFKIRKHLDITTHEVFMRLKINKFVKSL